VLLEDQPDNEDAAIMLAEIMAHQVSTGAVLRRQAPLLVLHCAVVASALRLRPPAPRLHHTAQGQHESAVSYFQGLLERRPCHYTVLVRLLGMLRGAGKLQEGAKYIAAAEAASAPGQANTAAGGSSSSSPAAGSAGSGAAAADGGLSYCKGLLQK
jgi:hypothetical protein